MIEVSVIFINIKFDRFQLIIGYYIWVDNNFEKYIFIY